MVTVIVPVYNDPEGIATTLDSLPLDRADCEILVVDNGSVDRTRDIVASYAEDSETVTLLVEDGIQSSYAARNRGIEAASDDVFAFVDADMTVPDDWLDRALDAFRSSGADYMGCRVELTLPKESPSLAARYDAHTGFPVQAYIERQHFAPTCCLFVHRRVIDDVGPFDHRLTSGGDKEFGTRVHAAGYDMHYAADVPMYHPVRTSLLALAKKDVRVGRGLCQLQRYHPERFGRPGVPPRPSGVKSPDQDLPLFDRGAFSILSLLITGLRGLGYYGEYFTSDGPQPDR